MPRRAICFPAIARLEAFMRYSPKPVDPDRPPRRLTRKQAARFVSARFFPISERTLERWPLRTVVIGRLALLETADVIAEAQRRLEAAPVRAAG